MSPAPDLHVITTWIFDLDETLYGRETGFLASMEERIDGWIASQRGGHPDAVTALRHAMRAEHGSTLGALIHEGGTDVDAYLAYVHDLPLELLKPDAALREALLRLPGRRLVFTNAPGFHAERVLGALGLADLFDGVFHCISADYVMKPHPEAFSRMIAAHAVNPSASAFFEDRVANLAPAKALGMTTVLVGPDASADISLFIDHRTDDLAGFLKSARVVEFAA